MSVPPPAAPDRIADGPRVRVGSVVSHGQTALVQALIGDLIALAPGSLDRLVLTLNLADEPMPAGLDAPLPFALLVLRNAQPKGFGANHNAAFRAAGQAGPIDDVVVLNPDLRIAAPDALLQLWSALGPGADLVAPAIIEHGQVAASARRLYTPWQAFKAYAGWGRDLALQPDWLAGMCLVMQAERWHSLGGFDERYFMYCEDVDLSLRLQLAGGHLRYLPQVQLVHEAQRASHRSGRALAWHLRSALRLWSSMSFWRYWWFRRSVGRAAPSGDPGSRP